MDPVVIFVNGQELFGWTSMSLTRSKNSTTGQLSVDIFLNYVPEKPILVHAARAAEILVYMGGHLAFVGVVDTRHGVKIDDTDAFAGDTSITAAEYKVSIQARGKTKYLIDSSHQHPTTNILNPTTRDAFNVLVNPWAIELDWQAEEIELDRIRLRDGAVVVDELFRLATENCYYVYETRDGKLRVCDAPLGEFGDPLILGQNILSFSASQSEEQAKAKIKVKGQLSQKDKWGEEAVLEGEIEFEDQWVRSNIPICVQHFGNGDKKSLERRAKFEANRRNSSSKKVTVEVFHVQPLSSEAWDIGLLHYVEIPCEGIFNTMECTDIKYTVDADGTLKTTLELSPPPTSQDSGQGLEAVVGSVEDVYATNGINGAARAGAAGVTYAAGFYPDVWGSSQLSLLQIAQSAAEVVSALEIITDDSNNPPMTLQRRSK